MTPEPVVGDATNIDAVLAVPDATTPHETESTEPSIEARADRTSEIAHDIADETPRHSMPPLVITMDSAMYFFTPNVVHATMGQRVVVNITAKGNHNFVIDELGVQSATPNGVTTRSRIA